MKSHRIFALLVVIVFMFVSLSGCKRSIPGNPQEPNATSESVEALPTNEATDVFDQIYIFATQTAMVSQGMTTPVPGQGGTEAAGTTPGVMPSEVVVIPEEPTATPMPVIVAPTATPGLPTSYTLHQGEFPYCIARRYNVNPDELLSLNGLADGSLYQPGLVLKIPQSGSFPGQRWLISHPGSYTVTATDTIYSIACKYGDVLPEQIAATNGLVAPYTLTAGQVLSIP
jgi:LysM repeat protein